MTIVRTLRRVGPCVLQHQRPGMSEVSVRMVCGTKEMGSPESIGRLRRALEDGDLRVLLMVLVHLTGDDRWLSDPYRPVRDVRLIADKSAGLAPAVAREIREAVLAAMIERGGVPALDRPEDQLFQKMMSVCLGEDVPGEYVPMMLQEMGFQNEIEHLVGPSADPIARSVLIVGAGISGICAAVKLAAAGVPFRVLEKNTAVGGTWWENIYPNCGVDTPNHFYSYSFAPNNEWSRHFSLRDEIYEYLSWCVDRFGIREQIEFGARVESCAWDETHAEWTVYYRNAHGELQEAAAQFLISAIGQLNRPSTPDVPGIDSFPGRVCHSANWPADLEFAGKRVGVVGAGASAMQLVPPVAAEAKSLTVFQRSPQWIRRIDEYRDEVTPGEKELLRELPYYRAWLRFTLGWRYGDGLHRHLQRDPDWPYPERSMNRVNDRHRAELVEYVNDALDGRPDLIDKLVPTYPPYAKRMLIDAGWYAALKRPNVGLVTEPLSRVDGSTVIAADGSRHELDVLVFATGFHARNLLGDLDVVGRDGQHLSERWGEDDPRAYLGMTVPGFPNFFVLYGPNTNLGHGGSIIFHAECQMRYVISLLEQLHDRGYETADVRVAVHDRYNDAVDEAHARMVWTHPGVHPWYRNAAGRVVSNSPWRLVDYWHMTRYANLDDYVLTPADEGASEPATTAPSIGSRAV